MANFPRPRHESSLVTRIHETSSRRLPSGSSEGNALRHLQVEPEIQGPPGLHQGHPAFQERRQVGIAPAGGRFSVCFHVAGRPGFGPLLLCARVGRSASCGSAPEGVQRFHPGPLETLVSTKYFTVSMVPCCPVPDLALQRARGMFSESFPNHGSADAKRAGA